MATSPLCMMNMTQVVSTPKALPVFNAHTVCTTSSCSIGSSSSSDIVQNCVRTFGLISSLWLYNSEQYSVHLASTSYLSVRHFPSLLRRLHIIFIFWGHMLSFKIWYATCVFIITHWIFELATFILFPCFLGFSHPISDLLVHFLICFFTYHVLPLSVLILGHIAVVSPLWFMTEFYTAVHPTLLQLQSKWIKLIGHHFKVTVFIQQDSKFATNCYPESIPCCQVLQLVHIKLLSDVGVFLTFFNFRLKFSMIMSWSLRMTAPG